LEFKGLCLIGIGIRTFRIRVAFELKLIESKAKVSVELEFNSM